jgi:uncharacterized protein (TIGR03083 family)
VTEKTDYPAALLDQDRLFAECLRGADLDTPVPTCPGWTLQQLLRHVGRGHLWAAQIVRERRDSPVDPRQVEGGKPPADADGALDWLRAGGQALLDAVAATGGDTPVWAFLGPQPAAWWIRRRLHETTVHRADAAIALGVDYDLAPELAADGVAEWLDIVVGQNRAGQRAERALAAGTSLHLHATDLDAEWTLRATEDGLICEPTHAKSTAAARGRAVDLLLALSGRRSADETGVELFGDPTVWQTWREQTAF